MILSCFMAVQEVTAQTWGGGAGTKFDRWTVNDDNSDHWSYLRLQVGNSHGWGMVNQGHLWWGYAPNGNHSDLGSTRKMELKTNGDLTIEGAFTATSNVYLAPYGGNTTYIQARRGDGSGSTEMRLRTWNNGQLTEAMHIDSQGNVGIGATNLSADQKLEVDGNILISGSDLNQMRLYGPSKQMAVSLHGTTPYIGTNSNHGFSLVSDNQYRMTVDADGNVGIGDTTPVAKLQIISPDQDPYGHVLTLGPEASSNLRLGYHADYSWIQSHGGEPLHINKVGNNTILNLESSNVGIGTSSPSAKLDVDGTGHFSNNVNIDGDVGIGTASPVEKLHVIGNIKADGVILNIGSFPDYVFEADYPLLPLKEVESYIKTNKHLPGFPSEAEVIKSGADLGRLNTLLVEKVEELTLYTIEQEKQIDKLSDALAALQAKLNEMLKKQ